MTESTRGHSLRVGRFVSPCRYSIGVEQPVERAREVMARYRLHHLPVLDGGRLAGVISRDDVADVRRGAEAHGAEILLHSPIVAMPYIASDDTPLEDVVSALSSGEFHCAVVTDGAGVLGLLTPREAITLLALALGAPAA